MDSDRIQWIDVAKAIGIFTIYLGHFREEAGFAYEFVFLFHVPLFFFLSGCLETRNKRSVLKNIYHKFVTIIIPFGVFGWLNTILYTLLHNSTEDILRNIIMLLKGAVRNDFMTGGLWFLTCLVVIEIIFSVIKLIPNKWIIFLVCMIGHCISKYLIHPPRWYYNLDSAAYYLIFYALGYLFFDSINGALNSSKRHVKNLTYEISILTLIYTACRFSGNDILAFLWECNELLKMAGGILVPLIIIWSVIFLSYVFRECLFFNRIGKNTLYLCGSEYLVKTLAVVIVNMFGVSIHLQNPVATYLYTLFLLIIANRFLVPIEKQLVNKAQKILGKSDL